MIMERSHKSDILKIKNVTETGSVTIRPVRNLPWERTPGVKNGQWFFWNKNDLIEVIYEENKIINVLEWNNSEKKLIAK